MNTRMRMALTVAVAVAGAAVAGPAAAGTQDRLGTGGNQSARIYVGARSVGIAFANVASVQGVEAMFANPAGLAAPNAGTEFSFSNSQYIADMNLNYMTLAQDMGTKGVIGLSIKVLSIGDIVRTTEIAPDGTGDVFSPTFTTLGLSYAKAMTDRVNFGGTIRLVTESVLQTHANTVSFDFGFQYETGVSGVQLGVAMQNFGPAQLFSGSDFDRNLQLPEDDPQAANRTLTTTSSEAELPALFAGSLSWPAIRGVNELNLHALYQSNSFNVDEFRAGAEYVWRKDFALRAGYKFTTDDNELFGLTYGLGVAIPVGGSKMMLDYAGQSVSSYFDDVQHLGLTFRF